MKTKPDVECLVEDMHDASVRQSIDFTFGKELQLHLDGPFGKRDMSERAADVLEMGAAVFRLEQQLQSFRLIRAPKRYDLMMRMRVPSAWTKTARARLKELLEYMSNSEWRIEFERRTGQTTTYAGNGTTSSFEDIALFSGGLDSSCGAATLHGRKAKTLLLSYYTRQKTAQRRLAESLGPFGHVQLRAEWSGETGRKRSFFHRAFLFLAAAGAVGETVGARRILQFENGVLATAVPPVESLNMTRHASPVTQELMNGILEEVLGGKWEIANPFLKRTKLECFRAAQAARPDLDLNQLLRGTDSCWSHNAITSLGRAANARHKPRNMGCGRCVPCIVRHTVFPDERVAIDLTKDRNRNNAVFGAYLRSYVSFLDAVLAARNPLEFTHRVLTVEGRDLLDRTEAITPDELHRLFRRFAQEILDTYGIRPS